MAQRCTFIEIAGEYTGLRSASTSGPSATTTTRASCRTSSPASWSGSFIRAQSKSQSHGRAKPEVQKTATGTLPGVFHTAIGFGDQDVVVMHLEILENHPTAKDAIDKLVDDVLNTGDPGVCAHTLCVSTCEYAYDDLKPEPHGPPRARRLPDYHRISIKVDLK